MSRRFTLKTLLRLLALVAFGGAFAIARLAPSVAWLGDVLLISAIALAVSTERERIAAFRTSESKLSALLASMDDVILILDRDGTYKEIVPTNPSLLYRPTQEMIGRR